MIGKFLIITLGYFISGVLICTFNSCSWKYDATICDIEFAGLNSIRKLQNTGPDRFTDKIGFELMSQVSAPICFNSNFQIFSTAYANTKCAIFQNRLLQSTYQLSLNRLIILNGDTILPNTNLLSVPEIIQKTDIQINEECKLITSTIIFRKDLSDQIQFETGEYEVTFQCSTNDNKNFKKTRRVLFKE